MDAIAEQAIDWVIFDSICNVSARNHNLKNAKHEIARKIFSYFQFSIKW